MYHILDFTDRSTTAALVLGLALAVQSELRADLFGSGANTFTIDFVTVANAGNTDDAGAGGGFYSSPYGGVPYTYHIGVYEISQDQITKATNAGMTNVSAGAWSGSQPAGNMTWYEAAAFVNWLNTSTGHQAAYDLTWTGSAWTMSLWSSEQAWQVGGENLYRHKDAFYFLPSEDEWYKAAYHKNDGVTANYWDYATASNSVPDGIDSPGDPSYEAVYFDGYQPTQPNAITSVGASSAYGTYGQCGNMWEWIESSYDGVNNISSETRTVRSSEYFLTWEFLRSAYRTGGPPASTGITYGFRVARISVPNLPIPAVSEWGVITIALLTLTAGTLILEKRDMFSL